MSSRFYAVHRPLFLDATIRAVDSDDGGCGGRLGVLNPNLLRFIIKYRRNGEGDGEGRG